MKYILISICLSLVLFTSCKSNSTIADADNHILPNDQSQDDENNWRNLVIKGNSREATGMDIYGDASNKFRIIKKIFNEQYPVKAPLRIFLTPEAATVREGGDDFAFMNVWDVPTLDLIKYMCRQMNLKFWLDGDDIFIDIMSSKENEALKNNVDNRIKESD